MPNLIPIASRIIAGSTTETVSAKRLHEFLEVGRDFSTWIKGRIAQYGFEESIDYITTRHSPKRGNGNRGASTNHFLTLDMAKELAMVERNEKGRQARRYFIECEKQLRKCELSEPRCPQVNDTERYALANSIISQLKLDGNPVLVPYIELVNIIGALRHYEKTIGQLGEMKNRVDEGIATFMLASGHHLGQY